MPSKRITRHIDRLILDPNNYRFIDRSEYKRVEQANVADARIQQRTQNFILNKNNENVKDLISSFTTNGFLDIDPIQAIQAGEYFLVIEGNRRIATLKYLYEEFKKGNDVGQLTESDFKSVDLVLLEDEGSVQHLISMGLHHISGKKRWNAVNESQLVSDLISNYNKTEQEVCDALGITKYKLRRGLRTLNLIKQYKESDYGDQFESPMYTIFETVISSPEMCKWIEWSDEDRTAHNDVNLERLFKWVSQTEETEIDEDGNERTSIKESIVSQYRQIKEIAKFINDPRAIERMEESRSIAEAYSYSDVIGEGRLRNALDTLNEEVKVAFNFSEHLTESDYDLIQRLKDKLDRLIPTSKAVVTINNKRLTSYFTTVENHFKFKEIFVNSYRKLNNIKVKNLSKVNIFVGDNNMGKTSLLESFYLLSQLNNINAFLDLEKYTGKFSSDFHSKWIDKNFISDIELEGSFNGAETSLYLTRTETGEDIERSGYLSTIKSEGKVKDTTLESSIHLYTTKAPELRFSKSQALCPATFTSPFRYNTELLKKAHVNAVREKYFDRVIEFIQNHLDHSIEKIEMINDEGESRFMVSSSRINEVVDITKYGEGLQRIFEIALLMVYSKDGVICIDEVDSAIHKSLLIAFTQFIQKTAEDFNVQVFLSTHSKECIDAFVKNDYNNHFIRAYALTETDGEIACKYIEGGRLERLIDSINFDIR